MTENAAEQLVLPVLPLKETVVFPESMTPLAVGQERSVKLIDDVVSGERMLALFTVDNTEAETPAWDDLYTVGTVAVVHKMIKVPDGTLRILVQGLQRVRLVRPVRDEPYLLAELEDVPEIVPESPEVEALTRNVQQQFAQIIGLTPYLPEELQLAATNIDDPTALTHLIASTLRLKTDERQELLELVNVEERLRRITQILSREVEMSELGSKIQSQVASEIDKGQREFFLRQQLKAIQEELGEGDDHQAEVDELLQQIEEKHLPEHVEKVARRELNRLERLPPASAEYGVIRTYLDWILSLPWSEFTEDDLDLDHARRILDDDHFDLEKVKERIIEYLAVSKLKNDLSGPILCFVGPPGVGKTSLGHSIARALGRKFARISVGGVRDESEIRGHRRTYIGAMPGTIVRAIRDAESANPVFLIDEIDKMGSDFRGDPAAAMLEVLDPEQHSSFRDHYLDLPFDLSKVLFICTANTLDTIPGPLLDRMDVIQLSGYTHEEKLGIAKRYLVPKQLAAHGLTKSRVTIPDKTLRLVITEYTREAGPPDRGAVPEGGDAGRHRPRREDQGRRRPGA
jgi:ATP-dependent Lon protease